MDLMKHFSQQLEYDVWANREVAGALAKLNEPLGESVRLLAHVVAAELLWLARLEQTTPPLAVLPELSLAECERQIGEVHRTFKGYFQTELPAALDRTCAYKNSKGEPWANRVADILTHVFMHSAYHRGQIALQMRQAGCTPAYTDFIHGVRQGLIGHE